MPIAITGKVPTKDFWNSIFLSSKNNKKDEIINRKQKIIEESEYIGNFLKFYYEISELSKKKTKETKNTLLKKLKQQFLKSKNNNSIQITNFFAAQIFRSANRENQNYNFWVSFFATMNEIYEYFFIDNSFRTNVIDIFFKSNISSYKVKEHISSKQGILQSIWNFYENKEVAKEKFLDLMEKTVNKNLKEALNLFLIQNKIT